LGAVSCVVSYFHTNQKTIDALFNSKRKDANASLYRLHAAFLIQLIEKKYKK